MTINSMILGLIAHPRVVKKAHEELDRVVGSSRFPTYGDEKNLPYIRAIVKEVSA
jgi:cytochrome P450